jgi:hypothetical protein
MSLDTYHAYTSRLQAAREQESGIPYFSLSQRNDALILHSPGEDQIGLLTYTPWGAEPVIMPLVNSREHELTCNQLARLRDAVVAEAETHEHFKLELNSFPELRACLGI